jgi:ribosomal protein S6--L-glutamate ligase
VIVDNDLVARQDVIGWREWASLPELGVPLIKVKIDTGAKTSALHAYNIKLTKIAGKDYAEFVIHPIQKNDLVCIPCKAEIVGMKIVKSSNGIKQTRPVVHTLINIGGQERDIHITLTNRDIMHHRMLLGRTAMENLLIDPSKSYCQGKIKRSYLEEVYKF